MGLLQGSTVYLAGPIEKAKDSYSWREIITPALSNLGITIWNPLIKPNWFIKKCGEDTTPESQSEHLKIFKECIDNTITHSYDAVNALKINSIIRSTCLRLANSCDFMICYVNGRTVGTFEELNCANNQGKPIIFLCENGLDSCWRFVQFEKAIFKNSIDEVIDFLSKIDNGTIKVDNAQWIFLPGGWPDANNTSVR